MSMSSSRVRVARLIPDGGSVEMVEEAWLSIVEERWLSGANEMEEERSWRGVGWTLMLTLVWDFCLKM